MIFIQSHGHLMIRTNIHETAIVDEGAILGDSTMIWHWTHVSSTSRIGSNCILGQNVFVDNNVNIGNNVRIQNNVSIYNSVTIDDNVFCGPSVVFTNVINPRAEISRKSEFRATYVGKGATLGANSTIICGIAIGKYSFIGAGSVVTRNVKDFALMLGVPATQKGWFSRYGEQIPLPNSGNGVWSCPHTKDRYVLSKDAIILI